MICNFNMYIVQRISDMYDIAWEVYTHLPYARETMTTENRA